ncbi:MAG: hypothetical protein LBG96_17045 [Tannerella sp.]|jgi:hypothetical protein|nr:hypothetical protein [Tannerella sp.]
MKVAVLLFITIISLAGCRPEAEDIPVQTESGIIVKAAHAGEVATRSATENEIEEPVVFTGEDIVWFNETTKEIRFKENYLNAPSNNSVIYARPAIKFYIDGEYLFSSMTYVSAVDSRIFNSLVFYYNITENIFYLMDGYPAVSVLSNPQKAQAERDENMRKIADEWRRFLDRLKLEGKLLSP